MKHLLDYSHINTINEIIQELETGSSSSMCC